jgi:hypothetical protein
MPGQIRADLALLEIGNEDAIDATRDCSKSSGPGTLNSWAATCLQPASSLAPLGVGEPEIGKVRSYWPGPAP